MLEEHSGRRISAESKLRRTFTLPNELVGELEAWRAAQRPIPRESQAVIALLRQALEQWRNEPEAPAVVSSARMNR
jgi:hypothetical protein